MKTHKGVFFCFFLLICKDGGGGEVGVQTREEKQETERKEKKGGNREREWRVRSEKSPGYKEVGGEGGRLY